MPLAVDRDDRVVVRVAGLFIQKNSGTRDELFFMIVVRHHVYQTAIVCLGRTAIAEEGFVDGVAIDRKWLMFGAIGAQTAAVLVFVNRLQWLVHVPNAAIAIVLRVECDVIFRKRGRSSQENSQRQDQVVLSWRCGNSPRAFEVFKEKHLDGWWWMTDSWARAGCADLSNALGACKPNCTLS